MTLILAVQQLRSSCCRTDLQALGVETSFVAEANRLLSRWLGALERLACHLK